MHYQVKQEIHSGKNRAGLGFIHQNRLDDEKWVFHIRMEPDLSLLKQCANSYLKSIAEKGLLYICHNAKV